MKLNNIFIWIVVIIIIMWVFGLSLRLNKLEMQCGSIWEVDTKLFNQICGTQESIARKLGALYGSDYDEWVRSQDKEQPNEN